MEDRVLGSINYLIKLYHEGVFNMLDFVSINKS